MEELLKKIEARKFCWGFDSMHWRPERTIIAFLRSRIEGIRKTGLGGSCEEALYNAVLQVPELKDLVPADYVPKPEKPVIPLQIPPIVTMTPMEKPRVA